MFTHIMVGSNNPDEAIAFYDAVLGAIGIQGKRMGESAFIAMQRAALSVSVNRAMVNPPHLQMAARLAFPPRHVPKSMRFTRRAVPMVDGVKASRVNVRARLVVLMALTCVIPMAIKFALLRPQKKRFSFRQTLFFIVVNLCGLFGDKGSGKKFSCKCNDFILKPWHGK